MCVKRNLKHSNIHTYVLGATTLSLLLYTVGVASAEPLLVQGFTFGGGAAAATVAHRDHCNMTHRHNTSL